MAENRIESPDLPGRGPEPGVTVAQLGARMHYAVPRVLNEAGLLRRLYTDICSNTGWPSLLRKAPRRLLPESFRRLADRHARGLPGGKVTAFPLFGVLYARRLRAVRSSADRTGAYLWAGREFCRLVLAEKPELGEAVYAFNSAALELLEYAGERGCRRVLEQTIAPRAVEAELMKREADRFPGWEQGAGRDGRAEEFSERERTEWGRADVIVCGSEFVRDGVAALGGPAGKCVVVPYGVNPMPVPGRMAHGGPVRVLTVGAVSLRKGSPYVQAASARLGKKAVFRMVGPVRVEREAAAGLSRSVELTGPVPRMDMGRHFAWADIFLLPSVCEGSATVVYEALGAGLPVVCTPNTGSVVRDGVEGHVVPVSDAEAVSAAVERLVWDSELRTRMGQAAARRASEFSVQEYGKRLLRATGLGGLEE